MEIKLDLKNSGAIRIESVPDGIFIYITQHEPIKLFWFEINALQRILKIFLTKGSNHE